MSILLAVMLAGALAALVLGAQAQEARRVGPVALVAEMVMLGAMVDTHVPVLGLVPAPFWALLLGGCAMGTAVLDRLRRTDLRGGDHLHALGMLLGAVFVLLGAGHGRDGGHGHDGAVLLPVAAAVAVHVGAVVWSLVGTRISRVEVVRRTASLASVLAMGAMVVAH